MSAEPKTFEAYRPLLFSIAYRMLGSAMDAEDMVQEAYLRYERANESDIQSPKAFLSTIIVRLCLDYLKSAKTQREQYIGTWLPEPLQTADSPGALMNKRETISIAFLVLLENLSPIERAVFLLRNVFDYDYAEIARIVGKSEANCRRYYHLAQQYLVERRPRFEPSAGEQNRLVESFLQTISTGNVDELTHLLTEDVMLYGDGGGKAPAVREPLVGQKAVIRLLLGSYRLMPPDTTIEIFEVNGTPSVLFWGQDKLYYLMNLVFAGNKIKTIHNILNPDKLGYFREHVKPPDARENSKPKSEA